MSESNKDHTNEKTEIAMKGVFEVFGNSFNKQYEQINLEPSYLIHLWEEDDWTFIIKLHSIAEYLTTRVLVERAFSRSFDQVSKMSMRSRLEQLKSEKLIPKDWYDYFRFLSQVRNRFVHDASLFNSTLTEFYESLKITQKREVVGIFIRLVGGGIFETLSKKRRKEVVNIFIEHFDKIDIQDIRFIMVSPLFGLSVVAMSDDQFTELSSKMEDAFIAVGDEMGVDVMEELLKASD